MTIASLLVQVQANTVELQKSVDKVHGQFDKLTSMAATAGKAIAGMFAATAVIGAIKSFTDLTGSLADLSAKTGIGTTALQKLKYAAEQNGGSLDQVTGAITKMSVNLVGGDKSTVAGLQRLGLSLENVRRMKPDEAFALIGDKIAGIESPMERAKLATMLFGKAGADMLPMFQGNLAALGAEAEKSGMILSEDVVAAGDQFGDTLGKLLTAGMAILGKVLGPFLPALTLTTEALLTVANVIGSILGPAMEMIVAIGLKVREFLISLVEKLIDFAMKIPGVSSIVSGLHAGFLALKDGASDLHAKLVAVKKPTDDAAKGLAGLGTHVGLVSEEQLAAAKAADKQREALEKILNSMPRVVNGIGQVGQVVRDFNDAAHQTAKEFMGWKVMDAAAETVKAVNLALELGVPIHQMSRDVQAQINASVGAGIEAYRRLGQVAPKALRDLYVATAALPPVINGLQGPIGETLEIRVPPVMHTWKDAIDDVAGAFQALAQGVGGMVGSIVGGLGRVVEAWGRAKEAIIQYKLQGGATSSQKFAAVAGGAGEVFGATGAGSTLQRTIGGASAGAAAGLAIGAAFAPATMGISLAVGAVAGAVVGLVRGLMQLTDYQKRVRGEAAILKQLQEDALKAAGSMDKLRQMASLVGIQIDEAFKSRDPKWLAEVLSEVNEKTQKLTAAMEEYGFTWEDLPVKARQSQMIELSDTLFEKTQLLKGAGIDYNEILKRQAADYAELIRTAVRTETEIPAALRPVIEDLTEMGLLVDENGNLMKELGEVKFAETLTQGFDRVVGKLDELIDRLTHGVGGALDNLGRRSVTVPIHFAVDDIPNPGGEPGYAHGTPGLGFVDFGRATPTWLHGREAVIPEGKTGDLAGRIAAALAPMINGSSGGEVQVYVGNEQLDARTVRVVRGAAARNEIPIPSSAVQRQVSYA